MLYWRRTFFSMLVYFLSFLLCFIASIGYAYEKGFNCGVSSSNMTNDGREYENDQEYNETTKAGYIGGYAGKSPHEIKSGGTKEYDLYLADRRGFSEYRFDVPNGFYIVKLHFSETQHHWRGLRVFDVWIEDNKVLENFDIFEKVLRNYTIDYQFATKVEDSQLNVIAKAKVGETLLSAIYVFSRTPDTIAPDEPKDFSAMGGYKQVILSWSDNREDDIQGYNVYRSDGGNFIRIAQSPTSRYIDNAVEVHRTYNYYVRAVDVYGNEGAKTEILSATTYSKTDSTLPVYELFVAENDMIYLSKHALENEYVPVVFCYQGRRYPNAEMRYRGNTSRDVMKKSFKIKFADDELFLGRKKINLQADCFDPSLLRSKLAYDLFSRTKVLTPAASFVHLQLNGEFMGVYKELEQIDQRFLSINGRDPTGNLYKVDGFMKILPSEGAYRTRYEKETNKGGSYFDLIEFIELINLTPNNLILETLSAVLDVEEYLDWYCVNQLVGNFDFASHNYYLYHDLKENKWEIIPWDMDGAFGSFTDYTMPIDVCTRNSPMWGVPAWWDRFHDRILSVPQFRRMYCVRLLELMGKEFTDELMFARIKEAYNQIRFDGERDIRKAGWHQNDRWFYPTEKKLNAFVRARKDYLRGALRDYMPSATVNLFINEVMTNNKNTIADEAGEYESWIELYNWGGEVINLGDLYLSDNANNPTKWRIPPIEISPREYLLFWADSDEGQGMTHANFTLDATSDFIGLFDKDGIVDSTEFALQKTEMSSGRMPDGGGRWHLMTPTPKRANKLLSPVVMKDMPQAHSLRIVKGESITHRFSLKNQTDEPQLFDLWIELFLSGGKPHPHNPIFEKRQIRIAEKETAEESITFAIPEDVSCGIGYKYDIKIGGKEDIWNTVNFELAIFSLDKKQNLYINEFMAANNATVTDEFGEYEDWVELYNAGEQPINLSGMYLSDDLREPDKWQIPDVEIPPFGFIVFWADSDGGQGALHTNFRLSASGEEIGLFDTDENGNATIDWISYGPQRADMSYGRYPDGSEQFEGFSKPTPGTKNISGGGLNLCINEFMANNVTTYADEAGEYDPWIEIYNGGRISIDMGGMFLSDDVAYPDKWRIPNITIPPDGFLLFWADGDVEQGALHGNFKLNPDGGTIGLFDTTGNRNAPIDMIHFGIQQADISLGRYPDGKKSLESFFHPTPGAKNILFQLYINEIMADNKTTIADEAGEYDDWIELYNKSDMPVVLSGMYLSDDMNNPTKWRIPNIEIPQRGFLLFWADSNEQQGELHTNFNLNAGGEIVALFDKMENGNALLDMIEFEAQNPDISYGRYPDGGASLRFFAKPSPITSNLSNTETRAGPITLLQNYPNPFNLGTWIPYKLTEPVNVVISIYDISGRLVRRFHPSKEQFEVNPLKMQVTYWDGRNDVGERVAFGVYFYTIQSGQYIATRKLAVRK
ncbi:CotH kinase family protein [bacterium]|nr:CotH kinase family protein [bacterium]